MAITGPWVGSSAKAVTGQGWMGNARTAVRLPASGWVSELIGRSKEVSIDLQASHAYNKDWLIDWLRQQDSAPAIINIRGDLVSYSADVPLFEFPSNLANEYVQLNIHGVTIYGRGGYGGGGPTGYLVNAQNGGPCIHNWIGGRLRINNGGAIAGGGGGGAGGYYNNGKTVCGGGGGRPFGAGGVTLDVGAQYNGHSASISSPGGGQYFQQSRKETFSGAGGEVGAAGAGGRTNHPNHLIGAVGAGGAAVAGNPPQWIAVGAVYGSRV